MRKITIFVFLLATLTCAAENQLGKFMLNTSVEKLPVDDALEYVNSHFEFPEKTTFEMFRDETDDIGMRHCSYQQYVGGVEVANAMFLVHSKGGLVSTINGDLLFISSAPSMPNKSISPQQAAKCVRKKTLASDAKLKIVRVGDNYKYAYEVRTDDGKELKYVDAESGEIIKTIPLVYNLDVAGTAKTMYSGTQNIVCYKSGQLYYLLDKTRNIYTYDASNIIYLDNYILDNNLDNNLDYNAYINDCGIFLNETNQWESTWGLAISMVEVESITKNNTWYTDGEGNADVYIKIKDKNGTLLHETGYHDEPTFPVLFEFSTPIKINESALPYYIEIWDYDPYDIFGGDDLITTLKIEDYYYGLTVQYNNMATIVTFMKPTGFQPALDAYWGIEKTYDFYKNKFNRKSFDGNNANIDLIINPLYLSDLETRQCNALANYADFPYPISIGTGNFQNMRPVVSVDVMAHEFTHLVTAFNGNGGLTYLAESGALNESFSDIIGISVKNYAKGKNNWLIGDEIMVYYSNMRSMKNPNNGMDGNEAQPDTYKGLFWVNTSDEENDHGGVHTNSGVQNFWYYLLCEGGSGSNDKGQNYNVTGIGISKAVQIAYRNLIYYLTPEATHIDARNGSIQAAIDLYGNGSQEVKSVTDAWYAVGVGNAYIEPFSFAPGKYVIVANRNKADDGNWYYMTSDLGTASNKRFQAVPTGTCSISSVVAKNLDSKYVWTVEADGDNWKIKNGSNYVTWTSGNTANLAGVGKTLIFDADGSLTNVHFNDGTAERYLALNGTTGNNYFAFYTGSGQIRSLGFIPYEETVTPPTPQSDRYVIVAQRNASSNWYYMTSDLGTASNKRYQAVDAQTSNIAAVNTTGLADKYYWQIDGNKLKTGSLFSTWKSGNSADLDNTGIELNIEKNANGTYKFSFVDTDSKTRYLAFNKTVGNDYFAYYYSQLSDLTLIKEGTHATSIAQNESELPFTLRQEGRNLIFEAQQPTDVSIFSPTGMVVVKADGITANTFRLAQGIYILRANYVTQKIIIK